jgi:hypothetical protein
LWRIGDAAIEPLKAIFVEKGISESVLWSVYRALVLLGVQGLDEPAIPLEKKKELWIEEIESTWNDQLNLLYSSNKYAGGSLREGIEQKIYKLGELINKNGGKRLMQEIHGEFKKKIYISKNEAGYCLEKVWHGIGDWQR